MEYKIAEVVTPQNYKERTEMEIDKAPEQYKYWKGKHPNALLLFRVGDSYEAYCEDAIACLEILGVTLTRGKSYRLAGFPYHALDIYLPKLIRAGKRVAICEPIVEKKKKSISEVVGNARV